jgi:hypothetical protein
MRKLIITEEERKSILGLHGIMEQTVTDSTTTQQTLTPAELKKQEYLKKRHKLDENGVYNWLASFPLVAINSRFPFQFFGHLY